MVVSGRVGSSRGSSGGAGAGLVGNAGSCEVGAGSTNCVREPASVWCLEPPCGVRLRLPVQVPAGGEY